MDPLYKPPVHMWQEDERLTLSLISVFFRISAKETAALFNQIFAVRLAEEGHDQGLRPATVHTMLHELQHRRSHLEPWKTINQSSLPTLRHKFWEVKNCIEDHALELDFELRLKRKKGRCTNRSFAQKIRRAFRADSFREDTPSSAYSLESDSEATPCPKKQKSRQQRAQESNIFPLNSYQHYDGSIGRKHPTLLFRAFDNAHRFSSRACLQASGEQESCPDYESEDFRTLASRHLMIDMDFLSPFVSLTEFPKAAFRYLRERRRCSIAIFVFHEIEADAKSRCPESLVPFLVPTICSDHNINNLPKGYIGRGEWLCYGSIQAQPLAIWSADEAEDLKQILVNAPSVSIELGRLLGKYFGRIRHEWQATVAYKFLCAYRVAGYSADRTSTKLQDFVRGLHSSARASPAPPRSSAELRAISFDKSGTPTISNAETVDGPPQYSSTPARNRRIIADSDDEDGNETPAGTVDNTGDVLHITEHSFQVFRRRMEHFKAHENVDHVQKARSDKHPTSLRGNRIGFDQNNITSSINCPWQIIDLTKDDPAEDETEVIFQSCRRISTYPRAFSIRSRSSTKT